LAPPTATIAASTSSVCQNSASPLITFAGSSDTAPYTFIYKINGGANQTISTTGTNVSITLPVNTSNTGTFNFFT